MSAKKAAAKEAVGSRNPRKASRKQIERAIDRLISEKHVTLYGRSFDVGPGGNREEAVRWFADIYEEVHVRVRG